MTDTFVPPLDEDARTPPPEREPTSWVPVDLHAIAAGATEDPPVIGSRTDGVRLLYAGKVHWLQGESEACKSWFALKCAAETINAGGHVLYVDFEDHAAGFVSRLRSLMVPLEAITTRATYIRPDGPLADRYGVDTPESLDLGSVLAAGTYQLAIIDGVTEAMTIEGLDLNDNADVATFMRRLPRRLAATGAAVAAIDHVPKSKDNRGNYAIGGQHKRAGVDGAAFTFEVLTPFGRGREGTVKVTVAKDRPGFVRRYATTDGVVAVMRLTSYPDDGVTVHLEPAGASKRKNAELRGRILDLLARYPGSTKKEVRMLGNSDAVDAEVNLLLDEGTIRVEQKGLAHRHYLVGTEPG